MITDGRRPLTAPLTLCSSCEYFDGGGRDKDGQPKSYHGDCHNSLAPRFETQADNTCDHWVLTT